MSAFGNTSDPMSRTTPHTRGDSKTKKFHGETSPSVPSAASDAESIINDVVVLLERQRGHVWLLAERIAKLSVIMKVSEMQRVLQQRAGLSKSMVSKLNKIGCTPPLMKEVNRPHLRPSVRMLYGLATWRKDDKETIALIEKGLADKKIHARMTFADLEVLQGKGPETKKEKNVGAAQAATSTSNSDEREYLSVLEVLAMQDGREILTMLHEKGILLVPIPSETAPTA